MSKDKYPIIFSRQMEAIVSYISDLSIVTIVFVLLYQRQFQINTCVHAAQLLTFEKNTTCLRNEVDLCFSNIYIPQSGGQMISPLRSSKLI